MTDTVKTRSCLVTAILCAMLVIMSVFPLWSCGKIDFEGIGDDDGTDGFAVRFNVEEYTVTDFGDASPTAKGVKKQRKAARELGTVLNFAVFQDGTKVRSVNQNADDDDFGSISVNLTEGTYQVVILIHSCDGNATFTAPEKVTFPNNKVTDTFIYSADLEVDGSSDNTIAVHRAVAKYRLTVADDIPENVATMEFYYTGGSSTLDATAGLGCVNSRQTEQRTVVDRTAGQVFEIYTFPHAAADELKITVRALDKSGATVKEQVFENVPVEQNKITNHTKAFFGGSSGGTIEGDAHVVIGGDDAWTGEINY